MSEENIYLKYTGEGSLPGVPARDLTYAEVKTFGEAELLNSGCYIKTKPKPTANKMITDKPENKGDKS